MGDGAIVVTGAAGALGRRVVSDLLDDGASVAALGRSRTRLEDALGVPGERPLDLVELDVARSDLWGSALARIGRRFGAIGGAVLAAGGYAGGHRFDQAPDAEWGEMFDANLETARASLRALLPGMVERGAGSIVVIASRNAERPWEGARSAAYTAAKASLVALAQTVAAEGLRHGVRVNAVLPSIIDTPDNRSAMPKAAFDCWVSTASLSQVIRFLLSDAARDVSGAALPVYGRV